MRHDQSAFRRRHPAIAISCVIVFIVGGTHGASARAKGYFDDCPELYRRIGNPDFIARVANSHGLSSARFFGQETPLQAEMILRQGEREGLCPARAETRKPARKEAPSRPSRAP
jgi:hypothetical protein